MDRHGIGSGTAVTARHEATGEVTSGLNVLASRIGELSERVREHEQRIGGILTPDAPSPASPDPRNIGGGVAPSASALTFEVRRMADQLDTINAHLTSITRRVDL